MFFLKKKKKKKGFFLTLQKLSDKSPTPPRPNWVLVPVFDLLFDKRAQKNWKSQQGFPKILFVSVWIDGFWFKAAYISAKIFALNGRPSSNLSGASATKKKKILCKNWRRFKKRNL
jgi:hypothetical protein